MIVVSIEIIKRNSERRNEPAVKEEKQGKGCKALFCIGNNSIFYSLYSYFYNVSRLFLLGIYQRVLMFKTCFETLYTAVCCYRSWGLTDALILLGAVPRAAARSELRCAPPAHMACPHINWFSRVSPSEPTHLLLSLTAASSH